MSGELPKTDQPSLLETHGDEPVTYRGHTLPLKAWMAFCRSEKPLEEMDKDKIDWVARELLEGRDPFHPEAERPF